MLQKVLSTFDRNLRANIAYMLRLTPDRPATTITYHPDGVAVNEPGLTYFIRPDGSTEWIVSDVMSLPVTGCRYPIAWAKWCVWKFLSWHWLVPPVTLVLLALAGMGFLWLAICPAGSNPFAEWALWIFPMLSWGIVLAMNLTLFWLLFASVVGLAAKPVARHIGDAIREAKTPALPAGEQPLQLDMGNLIAPDIPVWSISETETAAEFETRLVATRKMYGAGKYVVAVPYGIDSMAVCCPVAETDEFQDEILNVRSAIVGHSTNAAKETWDEYLDFLEMAAPAIREYCTRDRARKEGGAKALLAQMAGRSAGVIAALLIFAMPAFAQPKTVRLTEYLGNRATLIVPKQGEPFEATFQEAPIKRTGDGQKNLLLLLQSGAAFTDADNAGPLLAVYVGNKMLNPQSETPKARPTAQASAEPVSALPIGGGRPSSGWSLPDSAEAVKNVYRWKGESAKAHKQFMFVTFYYWGYASWWMRTQVFSFLFILLFVFGLIAVSCSSEFMVNTFGNSIVGNSFRTLHKGSAFLMACTLIIFGVVIGLDLLISAITSEWHWLAVGALSIALGRVIGWAIGKIVPNGAVIGAHGDAMYQNAGQRRIG